MDLKASNNLPPPNLRDTMKKLILSVALLMAVPSASAEGIIGSAFGWELGKVYTEREVITLGGYDGACTIMQPKRRKHVDPLGNCAVKKAPKMVDGIDDIYLHFEKPSNRLYSVSAHFKDVYRSNCVQKAQAYADAIEANRKIKLRQYKSFEGDRQYWTWTKQHTLDGQEIEIIEQVKKGILTCERSDGCFLTEIEVQCNFNTAPASLYISYFEALRPLDESFELKGDTSGL
jgi:hypothetical protein